MTEKAKIGHNNPPAHEAFSLAISDLFEEAKNHLDGNPIENQGQADDLGLILKSMKELLRDSEKSRKEEKQPFIDGGKEVDTRWKAVQSPAKLTIEEATKPLTVWRTKVQAEADAKAKRLREEAAAKELEAQKAREAATSLEEAENAEAALEKASVLTKTANKIDRAPTGLRTSWEVDIVDPLALGKWAWQNRRSEYLGFLNDIAKLEIQTAKAGNLPGVEAREVKKAQ